MFSSKNISTYAITISVILAASYIATKFNQSFQNNDEYDIIKKYLLNDSPLYGFNRPKIWIHSKYEINARKWKDFYSRNTTDLNQPYLHLTIKTIINHCGEDFNICLIDDESFSKLIPSWDIDLSKIAEPMKSQFRQMGMAQLVYYYGGMVLPNSFLCLKNLKSFYDNGIVNGRPFVCEQVNHTTNLKNQKFKLLFVPDLYIMGAEKNSSAILDLIEFLKARNKTTLFNGEPEFIGDTSQWCLDAIKNQKINLVGGELVGIKTQTRKTILLDNLMEEEFIDLSQHAVGIYIPSDEILRRPKYQWFAVLPSEEILKSKMIISKYLMASIIDSSDEYKKSSEIKSVVAI